MQFHDDIQALRRGELDLDHILGRIRSYLSRAGSDPAELHEALEQARRADQITAEDYDRLTRCIADASQVPTGGAESAVPGGGDEADLSMTRLATSVDTTGEEGQSDVDVGSRLRDRFILDEVIGVGGMGTVYRGRDVLKIEAKDRNPYVAIKILNDSFKQRPDAFIVLQREASRQQRLAHPNIATVYDFDRTGSVMFITMEYLDGISLDQYIKQEVRPKGGLQLAEALPIIEGMCAALSHAHARNIVHADFKPGNCLIADNKQLKVLDFGIARAMKDPARAGEETLFDPRSIGALTPAYASPEMLDNSEDADPRDDIYALACVSYELLSGRHPFHRIPADQAKANGLKPERIKHLTRRQNDALARALAFERAQRTASVQEFLEGLKQPRRGLSSVKAALAVGAGALVIGGAVVVPGMFERWQGDAVIADIAAGRVEEALGQLDDLSRQQNIRVVQEARSDILSYFDGRFDALMSVPNAEVDFAAAEQVLARAAELYPDSAALRELSNRFSQRRETYLSEIAQTFEEYLAPEYLLPRADAPDLHDLVERLAAVDPTNPLLEDSRIAGAYADALDEALGADRVAEARAYLDAGLALAPNSAALGDLRDRVVAAEQRLAREARVAELTDQLTTTVAGADTLDQALAVLPLVSELESLDPDNAAIAQAAATLAERFADEREAARQAGTLSEVEEYLERTAPLWTALAQPQMIEPVEARRAALLERQENLLAEVRSALQSDDLRSADERSVSELIAQIQAINPDDPRPSILLGELVQARRTRAQQHVEAAEWQAARNELAQLDGLALSAEQRGAVADELDRIDGAEQAALERAQAAERLAAEQQRAEAQRAEEERQRRLLAQREARIDEAAAALDQALTGFDAANPVAAIREALNRINALAALQASHPALAGANARLERAVTEAVRNQPDLEAGLALIETAKGLLGDRVDLAGLQASLQAELVARRQAEQRAAVAAAEARLQQALDSPAALADEAGRTAARRALDELAGLVGDDATRLGGARQRFVRAHLSAARGLIDAKRFSVAERVLEAASGQATGALAGAVADARQSLVSARDSFREERARQERMARIEALAQRFTLEVSSGQLTRARETLAEYRQLAPDSELARGEGARQLAAGYLRVGRQRFEAGNLQGARQLVTTGLEVLPGYDGLERLGTQIELAGLSNEIEAWFAGRSDESVGAVRALTQRYRELAPSEYAASEADWSRTAAQRLSGLRDRPQTYNRILQDARSVLNDDGALAGLTTILPPKPEPVPPSGTELEVRPAVARERESRSEPVANPLSPDDLFGRWCSDDTEIEFQRNRMVFNYSGTRANYRVSEYAVSGDTIHVNWDDRRLGRMTLEFGRFTEQRDRMVQLRGRSADDDNWQTYNRSFLRCG